MTMQEKINELLELRAKARMGGGEKRIEKQHSQGKFTARERILMFLDEGSFEEFDMFVTHRCTNFGLEKEKYLSDGVVTGYGTVGGRLVYVFSQDFTVFGGSLSETVAKKICKVMEQAMKVGAPVIGFNDSGGARIHEGVNSLAGYGEIFQNNILASGVVPQISVIFGPCAGGAVYSPALTDFIMMAKNTSYMFVTGPKVVKTVTNEDITVEDLGGANVHSSKSGVAHFAVDNEEEGIALLRQLLSYLPSNNMDDVPRAGINSMVNPNGIDLDTFIPEDPSKPYSMKQLIEAVVDGGYFFEIMENFAPNILIGFAHIEGKVIGIVANEPAYNAGVLDIDTADKSARFIRFCDCFSIPIVSFVDVPGFLPGCTQEHGGIIRHGAKIVYAYVEATVPKITVITRKAYGGAYIVMSSKHTGADVNFAYPNAEIAVMGQEGAVNILYKDTTEEERAKARKEYEEKFSNPYRAAELGYVDEIILPSQTREKLIQALDMTHTKIRSNPAKKHGNIPL